MGETTLDSLEESRSDRQVLDRFVVDNAELERLESLLQKFNFFEAVNAVRVELRHSSFIAFLLDPSENHGLGDALLRKTLQSTLMRTNRPEVDLSPIEIDVWDLHDTVVLREWKNIDIVAYNEEHRLVAWIENKIDSSEHSGQLARYRSVIESHFSGWHQVGIFLTPDGANPSDDGYLPVDYSFICGLLEDLVLTRESTLGPDVATAIAHYTEMLRRHIVSESEVQRLAQMIYKKHKRALDLIYEHRPDLQLELAEHLKELLKKPNGLSLDHTSKAFIRFCHDSWDSHEDLGSGDGWTRSKRLVLFEFKNLANALRLALIIGPGPQEVRQRIFDGTRSMPELFRGGSKTLHRKWTTVWTRSFVSKRDFEDKDPQELKDKIDNEWMRFSERELPALVSAIESFV